MKSKFEELVERLEARIKALEDEVARLKAQPPQENHFHTHNHQPPAPVQIPAPQYPYPLPYTISDSPTCRSAFC